MNTVYPSPKRGAIWAPFAAASFASCETLQKYLKITYLNYNTIVQ